MISLLYASPFAVFGQLDLVVLYPLADADIWQIRIAAAPFPSLVAIQELLIFSASAGGRLVHCH